MAERPRKVAMIETKALHVEYNRTRIDRIVNDFKEEVTGALGKILHLALGNICNGVCYSSDNFWNCFLV